MSSLFPEGVTIRLMDKFEMTIRHGAYIPREIPRYYDDHSAYVAKLYSLRNMKNSERLADVAYGAVYDTIRICMFMSGTNACI